jgi:hypothetical protein
MNPSERRRTAFHEAGHFVVAHVCVVRGLEIQAISLCDDGPHAGQVHASTSYLTSRDMVQLCTVLAAGYEAEALSDGWANRAAAATDLRQLRELCEDFFEHEGERARRLERAFHLRASLLLRRNWTAVVALASALERERHILAEQARRIVDDAAGSGAEASRRTLPLARRHEAESGPIDRRARSAS